MNHFDIFLCVVIGFSALLICLFTVTTNQTSSSLLLEFNETEQAVLPEMIRISANFALRTERNYLFHIKQSSESQLIIVLVKKFPHKTVVLLFFWYIQF